MSGRFFMFYVYEWFIVETQEIIYVGKGTRNRYKAKKKNNFLNSLLNRYDCDVRIYKYFDSESDAFECEKNRIQELKDKGQCICNRMPGGSGGTIALWTDERRKALSEHNAMKNKEISQKVAEQKKRPVIINGIRYKGQTDAAKELGVATNTVLTWLREAHDGKGNPCRYEDEEQRPFVFNAKTTNSKIVLVDGKQFESVRAAAKYIGCWPETVINCIKQNRLCKGFKCEYGNQQPSAGNSK